VRTTYTFTYDATCPTTHTLPVAHFTRLLRLLHASLGSVTRVTFTTGYVILLFVYCVRCYDLRFRTDCYAHALRGYIPLLHRTCVGRSTFPLLRIVPRSICTPCCYAGYGSTDIDWGSPHVLHCGCCCYLPRSPFFTRRCRGCVYYVTLFICVYL